MKRFLSVLLALAVAFTFTFGSCMSAFAAETEAQKIDTKAAAQQKVIDDAVDAQVAAAVWGPDGYLFAIVDDTATPNQKLLTAAALTEGAKAAKAAGANAIAEEVRAQKIANVYDESGFTAIAAGTIYNVAAYTAQFNAEKTAKNAEIAKIDATAYVAYDYNPTDGDQSDKATVAAAVTAAQASADAVKLADGDDAAAIATKIGTLKAVSVSISAKTAAEYQKDLDDAKVAAKKTINTKADSLKATLKSTYEGNVASATTPSDKATAEANLAAVDGNVTKVANIYLAQVDAVAIDKDTKPGVGAGTVGAAVDAAVSAANTALTNEGSLNTVLSQLANVDGLVTVANNKAAALKAQRETDGTIMYDSAVVDKACEAVVAKIKSGAYTTISDVNTASEWTAMVSIADTASNLVAYKGTKKTAVDAIPTTGYAAAEVEKINALKKTAKEAITDAANTDAVDAIMTKLDADIAALPTLTQTTALTTAATTAINTTLDYDAVLSRLYDATVLAAPAGTYDTASTVKDAILADATKVMVDAVLAKIDATKTPYDTKAIEEVVKANLDAAKAVVTGMPTVAAVEAQAAAVIAKIDAIPSTVTLADKETVLAADKAYNELIAVAAYTNLAAEKKVPGTKVSNLSAAKTTVQTLENNAACDAVKALKKATYTAADEAAYTAAKALADAYAETYGSPAANTDITDIEADLDAIKTAIDQAKYVDAAKAIEALPAEITVDNKAAVEAARAAYDALTDAQKTTFSAALLKKLTDAEATIAELTKYTDKDAKAYMFDMKVTATAKKVTSTKAKMTVKADVTELTDNGYTVTYKYAVKAPGSKKYVTKKSNSTKTSYTFTKLKKGKNTFKVTITVKNAEGTVVGTKTKTKTYTRK